MPLALRLIEGGHFGIAEPNREGREVTTFLCEAEHNPS